MTFKKTAILLFFVLSILLPTLKLQAQSTNTGFVSGNIWYSKDPFEEGDRIKIYTFIFNPDERELSGIVVFFDKTTLLGKKEFNIPAKRAEDVSVDWTATVGDHVIFGKIENAKFLISAGKYEEVYIAENETEKSSRTISKKIVPKEEASPNTEDSSLSVSDIKKIVEEKTPEVITKPIILAVNKLEEIRKDIKKKSEIKQEAVKKEIKTLDGGKTPAAEKNPILKPLKYAELFLLSASSFILNNKILSYGLSAIFVFFLFRYFFRKIF